MNFTNDPEELYYQLLRDLHLAGYQVSDAADETLARAAELIVAGSNG